MTNPVSPKRRLKIHKEATRFMRQMKNLDEMTYGMNCVVQQHRVMKESVYTQAEREAGSEEEDRPRFTQSRVSLLRPPS